MAWSERGREQEQERERLGGIYGEMSDGELLVLEGSSGDLTEVAQEALRGEMGRRGLEALPAEDGLPEMEAGEGADGWRTLHVFSQTFEAQAAFRLLERDGIEFAVEDRSVDARGEPVAGPAVQLALMVEAVDWERSVKVLRREAGLFPEAVVDPRGSAIEEERRCGELVGGGGLRGGGGAGEGANGCWARRGWG